MLYIGKCMTRVSHLSLTWLLTFTFFLTKLNIFPIFPLFLHVKWNIFWVEACIISIIYQVYVLSIIFKCLEIPLFGTLHMVTWIRHLVFVTFECFIRINAKKNYNVKIGRIFFLIHSQLILEPFFTKIHNFIFSPKLIKDFF